MIPAIGSGIRSFAGGIRVCASCNPFGNKFCEAEIENFCLSTLGDEDIRGFDIAVNYAFGVRGIQSFRYLDTKLQNFFERKGLSMDVTAQRFAVKELHGDERLGRPARQCHRSCKCPDDLERMRRALRVEIARAPAAFAPVLRVGISGPRHGQAGYPAPCIRYPSRRRRVAPRFDSAK